MNITLKTIKFHDYELKCKCGCGKLNYDDLFLMRLEIFRDILGSRLLATSGCRCIKHNRAVGGVSNSLHICERKPANAVDITPLDTNIKEVFALAKKTGLFNEVILHKSRNFIHLGVDRAQKEPFYEVF